MPFKIFNYIIIYKNVDLSNYFIYNTPINKETFFNLNSKMAEAQTQISTKCNTQHSKDNSYSINLIELN